MQGLVSTLHRNSAQAALVSQRDTSRLHDKQPVLSHRGRTLCEKETFHANALFYAPWQWSNQIPALAGNAQAVSLCGLVPVSAYARTDTTECLSALRV